jgi:hypothetical protein
MSYADLTYYKDTYLGNDPGTDAVITKYLQRATEDIDMYCNGPFTESNYPAAEWTILKNANCAQAEWYIQNGETYNTPLGGSESIGDYSYSASSNSPSGSVMASRALWFLGTSVFLNRNIRTRRYWRNTDE